MSRRVRVALALAALALALASCGPRDVQTPAALVGRWQGHVAWHDATTPLVLRIAPAGDSLAAWLFAPALGVDSLALGRLSFASPHVHFGVPDSAGAIAFDGWLRRDLVVGAFSGPGLGETNSSRLPQLALRQWQPPKHRAPWPDSLNAPDRVPPTSARSLGAWLRARAGSR